MNSATNQPVSNTPADQQRTSDPVVPVWLIVVLFLLLYWGAVYFDEHGGWFEPQVYAPYHSTEEVAMFNVSGGGGPKERGEKLYKGTCLVCHGPEGKGQAGTFPPLAGSDWVNEKEPGRMIRIVLQGFSGPGLKVNGQPFNTGSAMVPWNSYTDQDLADIITYVRGNGDWGNHASEVTPEQVKAVRAKVTNHPMAFNPDEINAISPAD
jgi:mono/diheme cytochrome c family protein